MIKSQNFISALTAVSEDKQRIKRLFYDLKRGPKVICGLEQFGIFLNELGVFRFHVIDDRLAFQENNGKKILNYLKSNWT